MNFLNLGWTEVLLILVLAFVVLGPDKVVKTGQDLGKWIRKISRNETLREVVRTTNELKRFPQKILDESMLDLPPHVEIERINQEASEENAQTEASNEGSTDGSENEIPPHSTP